MREDDIVLVAWATQVSQAKVYRQTDLPPPIVQGFERVQHISVLGVTLTYNLTMTTHIDNIITIAVHVFCMDCAPFVAMACRLLLCTLC